MRRTLARLCAILCGAVFAATALQAANLNYDPLNEVLVRNVRNGFVDYDGIRADPAFGRFVKSLGNMDPAELDGRDERLALLINAYNAFAIRGILDGYSPASWFGRNSYFKRRDYRLLGQVTSLKNLEKDELLPMDDPRVHFALVCGSISCPRLSNRAYLPETLSVQLDAAARAFVNDGTRNRFDPERRIAFLSRIFDWYRADFEKSAGSLQRYLANYADNPAVVELLARDGFEVRYVDYDWNLNGIYRGAAD